MDGNQNLSGSPTNTSLTLLSKWAKNFTVVFLASCRQRFLVVHRPSLDKSWPGTQNLPWLGYSISLQFSLHLSLIDSVPGTLGLLLEYMELFSVSEHTGPSTWITVSQSFIFQNLANCYFFSDSSAWLLFISFFPLLFFFSLFTSSSTSSSSFFFSSSLLFFSFSQYWPRRCRSEEICNISDCVWTCPLVKKRSLDCAQARVPECGATPQLRKWQRKGELNLETK